MKWQLVYFHIALFCFRKLSYNLEIVPKTRTQGCVELDRAHYKQVANCLTVALDSLSQNKIKTSWPILKQSQTTNSLIFACVLVKKIQTLISDNRLSLFDLIAAWFSRTGYLFSFWVSLQVKPRSEKKNDESLVKSLK